MRRQAGQSWRGPRTVGRSWLDELAVPVVCSTKRMLKTASTCPQIDLSHIPESELPDIMVRPAVLAEDEGAVLTWSR